MRIPDHIKEAAEKADVFGVPTVPGNKVAGTVGGLKAWLKMRFDMSVDLLTWFDQCPLLGKWMGFSSEKLQPIAVKFNRDYSVNAQRFHDEPEMARFIKEANAHLEKVAEKV